MNNKEQLNNTSEQADDPQFFKKEHKQHQIRICLGSSCFSRGNAENLEIVKKFLEENHLKESTDFRGHLCVECCKNGPNITIDNVKYHKVDQSNLEEILSKHFHESLERKPE
jgi:NADH:ubiquinone oxidoreductase subunit E